MDINSLLLLLIQIIGVYQWVLIARILLTWLPSINWYDQPFKILADITDPVLEPFRKLIPPIGMMDISPMVLFFTLSLLQGLLGRLIS